MTLARHAALILALPLLGACIGYRSESVTGTIVYPPGATVREAPDQYGTEVDRPRGEAARPAYRRESDPYLHAVRCAASQTKLLQLNTYMLTRQGLYDMEDAIDAWSDIAISLGAERNLSPGQVESEIAGLARTLPGREADRIAGGCVAAS